MNERQARRLPRFRISTLLLVTALFAVAVGWWLDHRRQQDVTATLNEELAELKSRELISKDELEWIAEASGVGNVGKLLEAREVIVGKKLATERRQ